MTARQEMQGRFDHLLNAYERARYAELENEPIVLDQLDDIGSAAVDVLGDDPDDSDARRDRDSWERMLEGHLEPFMGADWENAVGATDTLHEIIQAMARTSGLEQTQNPCEQIAQYIQGWEGEAAETFRLYHLQHLDVALRLQHEFAVALRGIIEIHAGIVETTHIYVMDLMRQAIESLGERAEELQRAERERLLRLADAIVDTAAEYGTEGPVGAAKEALKTVGGMIGDIVIMDTGGSTDDILNRLVGELTALEERVAGEQEQVRKALDDLDEFLVGEDKDRFVPLPVPVGSPLYTAAT